MQRGRRLLGSAKLFLSLQLSLFLAFRAWRARGAGGAFPLNRRDMRGPHDAVSDVFRLFLVDISWLADCQFRLNRSGQE
jgi:hypothetical protein